MISQELITNAFILMLSGAADWFNDKEIIWTNIDKDIVTVEFPTLSPSEAIFRAYHKNGKKKIEMSFVNGLLHGPYLMWYKNGKLRSQTNHKEGKPDGQHSAWFENGIREWEGNFWDGLRFGNDTLWYKNGKKYKETMYVNGQKNGLACEWSEDGVLISRKQYKEDIEVFQN